MVKNKTPGDDKYLKNHHAGENYGLHSVDLVAAITYPPYVDGVIDGGDRSIAFVTNPLTILQRSSRKLNVEVVEVTF